jgi:arylsulfatase A-like enzyme
VGLSLFSIFLVLIFVVLIFILKSINIKEKSKNIILIISNIIFFVISFFIFKKISYFSYLFYFFTLFFIAYTVKVFINKENNKINSILALSSILFLFITSIFISKFNEKTIFQTKISENKLEKKKSNEDLNENKFVSIIKGIEEISKAIFQIKNVVIKSSLNIDYKISLPKINDGENNKKKKNILLITIDAVTPFHLDLYGYKRKTAPNLTEFASKSLVFNKAISQGPNTRPAIASLITSKYVTEIYWSNKKEFIPLKKENLTFAEILKQEGYNTYGVLTHSYFLKKFGYNQGFDNWDLGLVSLNGKIAFEQETSNRIYEKFKKIISKMKTDEPNFIWLHFFDPHDSYVKRKEAKDWGNKIVDIYDNEINYTDIYLGKLFRFLEEKKLMDDFIIVVTSDHGEAFGKHGYMKHGKSVYNDQMWVPLIIKFPQIEHQIVEHEVSHLDIIPTVLDYLKIDKYNEKLSGKSILKKIKDNYFPPIYTLLFKKGKNQYSILYKGYKLNYSEKQDRKKLFDVRNDMREINDISNEHPEILYDLWSKLSSWIKKENKTFNMRNK